MLRSVLLLLLCGISCHLQAQHYSSQKAQLKMEVENGDCAFTGVNTNIRCDLDKTTGVVTFMMPVTTFQTKKEAHKKVLTNDCFSAKEYPMISFNGKLEDLEKWTTKKEGTFRLTLTGHLIIKNQQIPIKETVSIIVENNQVRFGFNTSVIVGEMTMNLDGTFTCAEFRNGDS